MVRQQVRKARKYKRKDLLNDMKDSLSFLHLLLTPDQEHQMVFYKVPITGFCKRRSLKYLLVGAKVPAVKKNEGFCEYIVTTDSFK